MADSSTPPTRAAADRLLSSTTDGWVLVDITLSESLFIFVDKDDDEFGGSTSKTTRSLEWFDTNYI